MFDELNSNQLPRKIDFVARKTVKQVIVRYFPSMMILRKQEWLD